MNAVKRKVIRRSHHSTRNINPGVQAHVFHATRADDSTSRQLLEDQFDNAVFQGGGVGLVPPYNVYRLYQLIEESNMLRQCIDAQVTNTVLTGWEVDTVIRGKPANVGEASELQSFIEHANSDESLAVVMSKVIRDRESVGFGFLEVIRDAVGDLSLLRHAPSVHTRLCAVDNDEVLVEFEIARGRRVSVVREYRKFRRFVQIVRGRTVWFKEFGDPRTLCATTGIFEGRNGYVQGTPATELVHFRLPSNDPYGLPKWINQIPSIIGSREAEEVNMRYFQDNTVPAMMLTVSNGRLTRASYDQLNNILNNHGVGAERQNKIILVEAVGEADSLDGKSTSVDLKVEKLSDARQSDGLFRSYDDANMAKVRSSFRLPPVVVGMSQDVNFATANVSAFIAESQVFAPERSLIDELLNKLLVNGRNGLRLRTAKLTSRTPSITSPDMVIKTLTALNVMGALTPRSAQAIANKMLQIEIAPYPAKGEAEYQAWTDEPIIFNAKAAPTDAGQNQKTEEQKLTEKTGEVAQQPTKNGLQ